MLMNILVLIKQVPDTETNIRLSGDKIDEASIKWIISPYDEIALEEAIRTREKHGGTVTVCSLGPDRVVSALRTAYAMGADSAIHIKADAVHMLDAAVTAEAIVKAVGDRNYDLIIAGRQGIDSDQGLVPTMFAQRLGIGSVIWVKSLEISDRKVTAVCEAEGGEATYEAELPVLITTQMGMNEPRYPSLKGIMASKKKPVETIALEDLGVASESSIEVLGFELPPARPEGRVIEGGDAAAKAAELVKALHEEIKVI